MQTKNIIFDLDGTLIDSSEGILNGFIKTFEILGVRPTREITKDIIGPPLIQTLSCLAGTEDKKLLSELSDTFKNYYDNDGYKLTKEFLGITDMLRRIFNSGRYDLYIATNKRLLPTKKIIQYLGWSHFFTEVYALDSFDQRVKCKSDLLIEIIKERGFNDKQSLYIGDRSEDYDAAIISNMNFIMAGWGFQENIVLNKNIIIINSSTDMYNFFE